MIDGPLDHPFIVINEQARGREFPRALLALIELDCTGNTVAGAASELPLIVYRRAFGSQIDGRRQALREPDEGCCVQKISVIGQVSDPAISAMSRRPADRELRQRMGYCAGSLAGRSAPASSSTSHVSPPPLRVLGTKAPHG
jgi:hypothetical protein